MELKINQCQVGRFNLCSTEQSFEFSMGLYENNKPVEVDGIRAILSYSGDSDEAHEFSDAFSNMDWVFKKCFAYGLRVISTRPYKKEALLFAKLYTENYEEIDAALLASKKARIEKEIANLQRELLDDSVTPPITSTLNSELQKQIDLYSKWLIGKEMELSQVIVGTEKHQQIEKTISDYKNQIALYQSYLVGQTAN